MPSIATNNLGPTVSKHLFELFILNEILGGFSKFENKNVKEISKIAKSYILNNKIIRRQILSFGLPIVFEGNEYLRGRHIFIPGKNFDKTINLTNIEKWVDAGWVDLRIGRIRYWQEWIKKIKKMLTKSLIKGEVSLVNNYNALYSDNIGELLGLIYSVQGGERRKEY